MERNPLFIGIAIACLVVPVAAASATVNGTSAPANLVSAPAYYWTQNYALNLQPGDVVSVSLTYTSVLGSDLDITLTSPFYASTPIPPPACGALDPAGCQAALEHYAAQRVGRVTCTDTLGASEHHPDGGVEAFTASTSTAGTHTLAVINYASAPTAVTAYQLTVTVMRGATDVTASTFNPAPTSIYTINNYVHCAALGLRN